MVNWFLIKQQKQYNGAKIVFFTNSAITTGYPHEKKKKEYRHRLCTLHKNLLKKDHISKCKKQNCKNARR